VHVHLQAIHADAYAYCNSNSDSYADGNANRDAGT
jgi:hypothetical protein